MLLATTLTTAATIAIVTQDQIALRSAPRESAQQQLVLTRGDMLEIRGEKLNYLQVYDHRRERAGYVRTTQVRTTALQEKEAPELMSVVRFLRDTPGSESLGIAYSAAYLKAASPQAIDSEIFDALGTMSERLARQASSTRANSTDTTLAAHLDAAKWYGVTMQSYERDGRMQLCYDGDAFKRVLAMTAPNVPTKSNLSREEIAEQRARAALALTRHDCIDPTFGPAKKYIFDQWRADILDHLDISSLPEFTKNSVRMRRAGVWAALAYARARRDEDAAVAANRSLQEFAAVNPNELAEEQTSIYNDAAIRVSASRWAIEAVSSAESTAPQKSGRPTISTIAGQPGETCVLLTDAKHDAGNPLFKHCTYGIVWTASARFNAQNTVATLAVQPLDTWREMWVLQRKGDAWEIDVIPPSSQGPDLGYIEFAGWVPGSNNILAVREAKINGRLQRSFEIVSLDSLQTQKQASKPEFLSTFYRWQDAQWKKQTVSIR